MDITGKGAADHGALFYAEQAGAGEIRFVNNSLLVQHKVADRGEVVEFNIAVPQLLRFYKGFLQLFVLDLQLLLVHFELMKQLPGIFHSGRPRFAFLLAEPSFSAAA